MSVLMKTVAPTHFVKTGTCRSNESRSSSQSQLFSVERSDICLRSRRLTRIPVPALLVISLSSNATGFLSVSEDLLKWIDCRTGKLSIFWLNRSKNILTFTFPPNLPEQTHIKTSFVPGRERSIVMSIPWERFKDLQWSLIPILNLLI